MKVNNWKGYIATTVLGIAVGFTVGALLGLHLSRNKDNNCVAHSRSPSHDVESSQASLDQTAQTLDIGLAESDELLGASDLYMEQAAAGMAANGTNLGTIAAPEDAKAEDQNVTKEDPVGSVSAPEGTVDTPSSAMNGTISAENTHSAAGGTSDHDDGTYNSESVGDCPCLATGTPSVLSFDTEMDLRVVRTETHFELVDVKEFLARSISVRVGNNREHVGWESVQPTLAESSTNQTAVTAALPHVVLSKELIMVHDNILEIGTNTSWILSFVARRETDNGTFDIVLGPISQCNCQIRFESGNTLGVYFTNQGYGVYNGGIPLPLDTVNEFHAITLMYDQSDPVIKLYQDHDFVTNLTRPDEPFWAEFGRIGAWFNHGYQANIALNRVYAAHSTTSASLPSINDFLAAKEFIAQGSESLLI
eukprot:CAMPEP_0117044790 /NCGR_PEP_ID=MMETSP0472-20121206/31022_1 /TAXON_ID=693140 ORGANISM="Tiarina fusus, Strain LIS" /NCGR_SAMPLE_ID=MMETSP0472 /ASSEMBLY_ACC=CAM_ASM_000603 /LENGTH=420 /DNA_ID=CAMNT_0004756615 /DNA_START=32 /DNA_END=1294 /DNA_ORIENTATION=-